MPPSKSPLVRVAAQFGYDLDETSLLTDPGVPATDTQAARLCAVLIEQASYINDPGLRYTISQDPDYVHGIVADAATAIERAYRAVAVLLSTAVSTGAARLLTPGGSRAAVASPWRPGVVRIAGAHGGPYPCQIWQAGWNGWARPRFTRDIVARLMADLDEDWHRSGQHPDSLAGQLLEDGNVLLFHDEGVQEVIHPDDDDMFAVGAGTWTWEEWPE
ncbi:hypothetical protein [Micromonospora sp. LOL_023]|uniref:hypothetical protein n=1 Tax=Micromonospora sp. LOL_023 TaxID=3345418 RepID=UPI003A84ACEA